MSWTSQIPDLIGQIEAAMEAAQHDAGHAAIETAQAHAPVRTGYLRSHIEYDAESGEVRSKAAYSPFVEFGTRHMSAHPFWTPAIDAARHAADDALRRIS